MQCCQVSAVMIVSVINVSGAVFVKWVSCVSLESLLIVAVLVSCCMINNPDLLVFGLQAFGTTLLLNRSAFVVSKYLQMT